MRDASGPNLLKQRLERKNRQPPVRQLRKSVGPENAPEQTTRAEERIRMANG
jgi:hypothetical protein